MKQVLPLASLVLVTCVILVEGYSVYYFRLFPNADCTKGYRPGGGIPIVKPIDAPVARAQKISIAFMAGKTNYPFYETFNFCCTNFMKRGYRLLADTPLDFGS